MKEMEEYMRKQWEKTLAEKGRKTAEVQEEIQRQEDYETEYRRLISFLNEQVTIAGTRVEVAGAMLEAVQKDLNAFRKALEELDVLLS